MITTVSNGIRYKNLCIGKTPVYMNAISGDFSSDVIIM